MYTATCIAMCSYMHYSSSLLDANDQGTISQDSEGSKEELLSSAEEGKLLRELESVCLL